MKTLLICTLSLLFFASCGKKCKDSKEQPLRIETRYMPYNSYCEDYNAQTGEVLFCYYIDEYLRQKIEVRCNDVRAL